MHDLTLRRATPAESDEVAALFRRSREAALPYLPRLHTKAEDRTFFRERVFAECDVWIAERNGLPIGFCALRGRWIDHLYVDPQYQGSGAGSALLSLAMAANEELQLWTFQRNAGARRFYEKHGFRCVRMTDGENEEREPDALYAWSAPRG